MFEDHNNSIYEIFLSNKMLTKEQLDEFKVQKSVLEVEKEKAEPDEHVVDVLSAVRRSCSGEPKWIIECMHWPLVIRKAGAPHLAISIMASICVT